MDVHKIQESRRARIVQLKASIEISYRRTMEPQETLGLENLGIEKPKAPRKRRQKKSKKLIELQTHQDAVLSRTAEKYYNDEIRKGAWCPPAIPSYEALPVPPLGSSETELDHQSESASDIEFYGDTSNASQSQLPLDFTLGSSPEIVSRYKIGQGFTPISGLSPSVQQPNARSLQAAITANKKPAKVSSIQKSTLSVVTYYGLPSFRIDKQYRHTKAQPSFKTTNHQNVPSTASSPTPLPTTSPQRQKPSSTSSPITTKSHPPRPSPPKNQLPLISLPAPKPTRTYLIQSYRPPTLLPTPQPLLLILDLNGTLLHRTTRTSYHPRPHLHHFLTYAFTHHSLLIWSSAMPENVTGVCAHLFTPAQRAMLLGEWGRDTLGLTPKQYAQRVQVYKRLDRIWKEKSLQTSHPGFKVGGRWGQHNTLLIDDSVKKASAQPFNHVEVPEFVRGAAGEDGRSSVLAQVVGYLEEARRWGDVSGFVRGKRFEVGKGWTWDWMGNEERGEERVEDDDEDDGDGGVKL